MVAFLNFSLKRQTKLEFPLGSPDFPLHPFLRNCYTASAPAKENRNDLSLLVAWLLGEFLCQHSSICFLHLNISIVKTARARFSSMFSLLRICSICWNRRGASPHLQDRPLHVLTQNKAQGSSMCKLQKMPKLVGQQPKEQKRRGNLRALLIHLKKTKNPRYCCLLCSAKEKSRIVTQSAKQFL